MTTLPPNVFSIPSGENFLSSLVEAVLSGGLPGRNGPCAEAKPDALSLATYTILLPNRRACRALQDAFLRHAGQGALLLPQIRPVTEVEEDEQLLSSPLEIGRLGGGAVGDAAEALLEIPPAVSELERRLVLTEFILKWIATDVAESDGDATTQESLPMSPAQATNLARELAALMDETVLEQADFSKLASDMPPEFAAHWERTLSFLKIATEAFPSYLTARNRTTGQERQTQLLSLETRRLQEAVVRGRGDRCWHGELYAVDR